MTITWSPALAPPFRSDDDEPPLCLSQLYVPAGGYYLGPLSCIDDVGHPRTGGPGSLHTGGSAQHSHRWSDAEALESLAVFGPSARKTGPLCTVCNDLPQSARGLCASCAAAELAGDDIETESEAA